MNSIHYLYAALFATAVIHFSYMGILLRRYKRLEGQMKELDRKPR
ncbi:MAG TPA: hypothetical protein VI386_32630 [Candidatus Sulfotelmatobacter sp.]